MVQVVAAIIEREGRVLVCRRRADQSHPLQWEFPGGKLEPGETPAEALERELEEELAITQAAGEEMARYEYTYPGRPPVLLIFIRVTRFHGEPKNLIFQEMCWAERERLAEFDFLAGDRAFLAHFARLGR